MDGPHPVRQLDVLIVDELGKNISGAGMDPNVIGRRLGPEAVGQAARPGTLRPRHHPRGGGERHRRRVADMTTQRLVKKINYAAMYMNCHHLGRVRGRQAYP